MYIKIFCKRYCKSLFLLSVLSMLFVVPLSGVHVSAVSAAELAVKKKDIAIADTYKIKLKDKNKLASFRYTSSQPEIAAVTKKGIVTGKKAGTAKITVTQIFNKKKSVIGTLAVTVKEAELADLDSMEQGPPALWHQPGYYRSLYNSGTPDYLDVGIKYMHYRNPQAEYWYSSGDEAKLLLEKDGAVVDTFSECTVEVFVHETYRKKTRTVGSVEVLIIGPHLANDAYTWELAKGDTLNIRSYIRSRKYRIQISDSAKPDAAAVNNISEESLYRGDEVLAFEDLDDSKYGSLRAVGVGSRYLHVFMYDYMQQKYTDVFGSAKINVTDVQEAEYIKLYDREGKIICNHFGDSMLIDAYNTHDVPFYTVPYKYCGSYEITSSDESVVKAVLVKSSYVHDMESTSGCIYLTACHPGTAEVTLKAGGAETTLRVTVNEQRVRTNDIYYMRAYFTYDGTIDPKKVAVDSSDPSVAVMEIEEEVIQKQAYPNCIKGEFRTGAKPGSATLRVTYDDTVLYCITVHVEKP